MVQRATITRVLVAASVLLVLGANPDAAAAEQHGFAVFEWYRVSQVNAKVTTRPWARYAWTASRRSTPTSASTSRSPTSQTAGRSRRPRLQRLLARLHHAGADVVLNAHDHHYERFAPQSPDAKLDRARGIREFVVGTGGKSLEPFAKLRPNSEVRNDRTFGVLVLTLHPRGYDWRFMGERGARFGDRGSASSH
jgi:hypothetical protein